MTAAQGRVIAAAQSRSNEQHEYTIYGRIHIKPKEYEGVLYTYVWMLRQRQHVIYLTILLYVTPREIRRNIEQTDLHLSPRLSENQNK